MRIDSVTFENFRQHQSLNVELGPGMIGIVGPNGSGKSNFIKGILRALTGATGDAGKNEDDITDFRDKGFVSVGFNVNGVDGVVKRQLKSSGCTLKFGSDQYKSAADVAKVIYKVMDVKPKLLPMVFIEQGQLESVLFSRASERAEAFQTLTGTSNAEKIRELIETELKQTVAEDRDTSIKVLEAELSGSLAKSIADVETAMRALKPMAAVAFDGCKEIVSSYETQVRSAEASQRAQAAVTQLETTLAEYNTRLADVNQRGLKATEAVGLMKELYQEAVARIADFSACKFRHDHRAALVLQSQNVKRQLSLLLEPKPTTSWTPDFLEKKRAEFGAISAELAICNKILARLAGHATCPTCEQSVDQKFIESKLEYREKMLVPASTLLRQINQADEANANFTGQLATWKANKASLETAVKETEAALAALPDSKAPDAVAHAEDLGLRTEYEGFLSRREALVNESRSLQQNIQVMMKQLNSAKAAVISPSGDLITVDEYTRAKGIVEKESKQVGEIQKLHGRLDELLARKKTLTEQISTHQSDMAKMAPIRAWKELLERARLILHRDQLPAMVTRAFLKPLNVSLNHYLKLFQVPFTVVINQDQTIDCVFTNGAVRPAIKLSGAQKVSMGVAFRFAVYDQFARNLGFLVLDEPTPYMDVQRREGVLDLLMSVKSYSRQSGLQVIVVTHDQTLLPAFDKIIEFKEPIYAAKESA